MFKKLLYFFALILIANTCLAQVPNYAFQAVSGTYTAITGGTNVILTYGTSTVPYDDGVATPANAVPIGFTFNYNGTDYTTIRPCANGWATFSSTALTANTDTWTNNLISGPAANQRPLLAPLWDDMDMGAVGAVTYLLTGASPNRVLTIQWAGAKWDYGALSGVMSFQIKLYETTNVIEFVYKQETGSVSGTNGGGASIGITGTANNSFISLADASANPAYSYTTETTTILTKPATGQIYRWIPYCTATATYVGPSSSEKISNVTFNTFNNSSTGEVGYQDFTSVSTTVQPANSYPISITLSNSYNLDQVAVFIDFNHNGIFTDAGETVYTSALGAGPFTGTVSIPAGAMLGNTRMRVRLHDTGSPPLNLTPCGTSAFGQVEDYTVDIELCSAASVTTQPANTVICNSGNGTISLVASGTGVTYQWQVSTNGGTSYTNLTNTAPYSGVTTNTLLITGATTAMNGYKYRAILNGLCSPANTPSNAATLTINSPTAITTQPALTAQTCERGNASFTVAASNNATYQWQVSTDGGINYTNISGETLATLNLTGVTNSMNGNRYRAVATVASCNTVTSNATILTVNSLPTLTLGVAPISSLRPGLSTILSAAATPASSGNTFTWYKNGVQVAVTNTNSLLLNLDVSGIGTYTAKVTDSKGCSSDLSNQVNITDSVSNRLFIYPNPSTGFFHIRYYTPFYDFPSPGPYNFSLKRNISIYDSKGVRLMKKEFFVSEPYGSMDVNLNGYGKGVYMIDIRDVNENRLVVGKVVIQ